MKISKLEFSSMILMLFLTNFLGIGIFSSIKSAGVDSYFSIIIASFLGLIILYFFITIFNYQPELNLKEKIITLFGKKVGFIINVLFVIGAAIIGVSLMYNLTVFITTQILQFTPPLIIAFLFALLVIWAVSKDIKAISSMCFILVIINLTLYLLAVFNLTPQIEIDNLKPILEYGIKAPLKGSLYIILFNISPIFLFLGIPKKQIKSSKKQIILAYFIALLLMFIISFVTLGNLGIHLSRIYQFPEYIVLKKVNYFNFLDRVENIINIQWIFGIFFSLTFITYFIKSFVKKSKNKYIIPSIIIFIIMIFSLIVFKNSIQFNNYIYTKAIYIRGIILLLIFITFIKIKLSKYYKKTFYFK